MPRNRYTRFVHKIEQQRFARQEKELATIKRMRRIAPAELVVSAGSQDKDRHRRRWERKRLHDAKHADGFAASQLADQIVAPGNTATRPAERFMVAVAQGAETRVTAAGRTGGSRRQRIRHRVGLVASGLVTVVALVAGCGFGASTTASTLAANQRILASCGAAHPPASWVAIDGTGSSADSAIFSERMAALQTIVRQTAVCSGYLKVLVFTSSSTATATLFDGSLRQPGATSNARLQRVPKAIAADMAAIRKTYGPAVAELDPSASDIVSEYRLAGEWRRQLGGAYRLHLYLFTDGAQNVGIKLGAQALTVQQAATLARRVAVQQLPGAEVVVAGLGRVTGSSVPSAVVEGWIAYYDALCARMHAGHCLAVSDYQAAGW
ncbi:MAG: hypothetical protein ACRDTS_16690 [Mycobacterium sp.]